MSLKSTITTTTDELNTLDNVSVDQATPTIGDAGNIHGRVFLDTQTDGLFTTGDLYLSQQSVLLAGIDIFGVVYGPDPVLYPAEYLAMVVNKGLTGSQYVTVPSSSTDSHGSYYFVGLNPGTYATRLALQSGDISVSSTG